MGEILRLREEDTIEEAQKTTGSELTSAAGGIDSLLHAAEDQIAKDKSFETLFGAMADAVQYADTIHKIPDIAKKYPALQEYCKRKIAAIREFSEQAKQSNDSKLSWETIDFFHALRRAEEELANRDIKATMPDLQFEKMTALDAHITTNLDYQRTHPSDTSNKQIQEYEEALRTLDTGFESYLLITSENPDKDAPFERADYLNNQERLTYRTRAAEDREAAYMRFRGLLNTQGISPDIHAQDIKITR